MNPEYVGDLQRRTWLSNGLSKSGIGVHEYLSALVAVLGKAYPVQRGLDSADKISADMRVSARGTYGFVAEKGLNDPEIFPGLHQVSGAGVT